MDIRENKGSVSCHPAHDLPDSKTVRDGRHGIGAGTERAGKPTQKGRRTSGSPHSRNRLFGGTGRPGAVDVAVDRGRTGAPWRCGEYFKHSSDGNTEKNELKPWQKKEWCIPKAGAEFVARMEDILDVYQRPYDPLRPVICLDETNRQLIEKRSLPAKPGSPEREDYEYRRCGVADLFVAFEPLACKRTLKLTNTRTAIDFAHFLRELLEVHYSHCEKIVLVMDNLNIHSIASLYKAFEPAVARRIAQRLEIHYTPIHASWLNMAEIEIGILSKQCLSQSLTSFAHLARLVNAWTLQRNSSCSTVHWRFSTSDARCKLRKLYPVIL